MNYPEYSLAGWVLKETGHEREAPPLAGGFVRGISLLGKENCFQSYPFSCAKGPCRPADKMSEYISLFTTALISIL